MTNGAVVHAGPRPARTVAVGPRGLDFSTDDGVSWKNLDTLAYWSVGFGSRTRGWAVGPSGRITLIKLFE